MPAKIIFIDTLGCKVNQYETRAIRELLLKQGYTFTEDVKEAGIFILNSCVLTEEAERDCGLLIEKAKKDNPGLKIVAVGCLAETGRRPEGVEHFVLNSEKSKLFSVLLGSEQPFERLSVSGIAGMKTAYVKIAEGCEKFCSFCVDPFVRGKVKSRDIKEIHEEIVRLAEAGAKEIVLTGTNIGCYGEDLNSGLNLASVLSVAASAVGDGSVRLDSIEPEYVTDDLLDVIDDSTHVLKHLHIPLQSGDDTILRLMNRKYTTSDYRKLIGKAKSRIKGMIVTSDLMVGFPGETEKNFQMTVSFAEECEFASAEVYMYSDRPGTSALGFEDKVPEKVKVARYEALRAKVEHFTL